MITLAITQYNRDPDEVEFRVERQDETRINFTSSDGMQLLSCSMPEAKSQRLYLRGTQTDCDRKQMIVRLSLFKRYVQAIREYHRAMKMADIFPVVCAGNPWLLEELFEGEVYETNEEIHVKQNKNVYELVVTSKPTEAEDTKLLIGSEPFLALDQRTAVLKAGEIVAKNEKTKGLSLDDLDIAIRLFRSDT